MTKYEYHVVCDSFRHYGARTKIDAIVILRALYPQFTLKEAKEAIENGDTKCKGIRVQVNIIRYCAECNNFATYVEKDSTGYRIYKCDDHVIIVLPIGD